MIKHRLSGLQTKLRTPYIDYILVGQSEESMNVATIMYDATWKKTTSPGNYRAKRGIFHADLLERKT